ncbi:MAG: alpha-hydroxy-acid oxidizing protein [Clostridia bacterium]|nr:alpha-hydroxy-acid oxidizing protein [Clostridia bacterium]
MNASDSNLITRAYLDSILIETRYINGCEPDTTFEFFGRSFPTPIMSAALSHLDRFMFDGAMRLYAEGMAASGALMWLGMTNDREAEMCAATGASIVEIIKPYADRECIYARIRKAEELGFLAVGVDIDHSFGSDGKNDVVNGCDMRPLNSAELTELKRSTRLPFIVKGVLSEYDLKACKAAGADGVVISHHNNRIAYALPPARFLRETDETLLSGISVFADCVINSGADAFKYLCLGAQGVCVGRPLMTAIKEAGAQGVSDWVRRETAALRKYMAFTGCKDLKHTDKSVLHFEK